MIGPLQPTRLPGATAADPRRQFGRFGRAFTLVELIVTVVILGLLAAVGAFAYNQVTESSRKHAARSMAVHYAHDATGVAAARQLSVPSLVESVGEDLDGVGTDVERVPDHRLLARPVPGTDPGAERDAVRRL